MRTAPLIVASLAMTVAAVAPALAQEDGTATEVPTEPEVTSPQYDAQATPDASLVGSDPNLNAAPGIDVPALGQQLDPGPEQPSSEPPEVTYDAAQRAAQQATLAAQQAFGAAQVAAEAVEQADTEEEAQAAQEAAVAAQEASDVSQTAAQDAQQAAAEEDVQAAQGAAQVAQQASGTAQAAAQAAQQAVDQATGTDAKEAYTSALQATRSAAKGNNVALAVENDPEESGADSEESAGGKEAADEEASSDETARSEDATGKAVERDDADGEAEPKEDLDEAASNAAAISDTEKGGVPLFLGGSALLVTGIFVARKVLWP